MMREAWRPVGDNLNGGLHSLLSVLMSYPPLAQGVYYLLTGLWPWISMTTFLWVTGSKTDLWLVQTVGALITVIGATLCVAAYFKEGSWSVFCLALGTALALAVVEVLFVFQGRISFVYLLDAVLQVGLVSLWLCGWRTARHTAQASTQAATSQAVSVPVASVYSAATFPEAQPVSVEVSPAVVVPSAKSPIANPGKSADENNLREPANTSLADANPFRKAESDAKKPEDPFRDQTPTPSTASPPVPATISRDSAPTSPAVLR